MNDQRSEVEQAEAAVRRSLVIWLPAALLIWAAVVAVLLVAL